MARYSIRLSALSMLIVAAPFLANADLQPWSHVEPTNQTLHRTLTGPGHDVASIDRSAAGIEISAYRGRTAYSMSLAPRTGDAVAVTRLFDGSDPQNATH